MLSLPVGIPQAQPLLTSPLPGDPCVKGKRWKVTALPPLYLPLGNSQHLQVRMHPHLRVAAQLWGHLEGGQDPRSSPSPHTQSPSTTQTQLQPKHPSAVCSHQHPTWSGNRPGSATAAAAAARRAMPAAGAGFSLLIVRRWGWFGCQSSRGGGESLPAAGTHTAVVAVGAAGQGTCRRGGSPRGRAAGRRQREEGDARRAPGCRQLCFGVVAPTKARVWLTAR